MACHNTFQKGIKGAGKEISSLYCLYNENFPSSHGYLLLHNASPMFTEISTSRRETRRHHGSIRPFVPTAAKAKQSKYSWRRQPVNLLVNLRPLQCTRGGPRKCRTHGGRCLVHRGMVIVEKPRVSECAVWNPSTTYSPA